MPHVELINVNKYFGAVTAIRDLSFSADKGSFVALLGPSGCGKSTLLRMIAGLEDVSDGTILINGRDVTDVEPAKRQIAMVFQSYALYPHMTVRDNIGFSLSIAHRPRAEIETKSLNVARMLRLEDLLDRRPAQLSGGQRQRVAIGRALVREPEVFLFDEPLSNLDAMLRVQMRLELARLHRELGITTIYVTHDQTEAMTLADRIVVLHKGEISQVGSPLELYEAPANKFVASFIGSPAMNFLPVSVTSGNNARVGLSLQNARPVPLAESISADLSLMATIEIGIRPEHMKLTTPNSPASIATGMVQLVERLGIATVVYVDCDIGTLTVHCDPGERVAAGSQVGLSIDAKDLHFFDESGRAMRPPRS